MARSFADRLDCWIDDHTPIVRVGDHYTISTSDIARAAKALKRPVTDVEAAIAEAGFYKIEADEVREERDRTARLKAAEDAKNAEKSYRMVNLVMLGMGGLVVLAFGWYILAVMGISNGPQSPGEKACSDLGGRTSLSGDRCVF